jgi:2-aminobenzoate-CoA ligase
MVAHSLQTNVGFAMTDYTSHIDSFARDNLPPREQWPEFLFELPELQYPDRLNCAVELLDKAVQAGHGDRVAVASESVTWTYRELLATSNRIANVLENELGLIPGHRVLLHSPNNPMLAACWFAIVKAGGVVVATMPMLRARELSVMADKARIGLALCDHRLADELQQAASISPVLKKIVCFGNGELEDLMEAQSSEFDNVDTARDDVCLFAFTSGTTGVPKATVHFHRDVLAMADTFSQYILQTQPDDIYSGSPPIAFTFGLGAEMVFPMRFGGSTVLIEAPSVDALLEVVQKFKVTCLFTAPTMYRALLTKVDDYDISSLRRCVSAGEALPMATSDAWKETTGIRIIDGIGTTEMIHIFISAAGEGIRPGATGKPIPGYEACILDDDNNPLPPGNTGRLAVKGPTGCRYLADERQEQYVINGWNITGDIYKLDEDGYYWFQARADDMIISGGYNIASPEVEYAVLGHEAVAECAVVGSPDRDRGNIVKAFVVLKEGVQGSDDLVKNIQDLVKQSIAPYKYPRRIEFVESLPKTQTGKLQRRKLRE